MHGFILFLVLSLIFLVAVILIIIFFVTPSSTNSPLNSNLGGSPVTQIRNAQISTPVADNTTILAPPLNPIPPKSSILVNGKSVSLTRKNNIGNLNLDTLLPIEGYSDDDNRPIKTPKKDKCMNDIYFDVNNLHTKPKIPDIVNFLQMSPRKRQYSGNTRRNRVDPVMNQPRPPVKRKSNNLVTRNSVPINRKTTSNIKDPLDSSTDESPRAQLRSKSNRKDPLDSSTDESPRKCSQKDPLNNVSPRCPIKMRDPLNARNPRRQTRVGDPLNSVSRRRVNRTNLNNRAMNTSENSENSDCLDEKSADSCGDLDTTATYSFNSRTGEVTNCDTVSVILTRRNANADKSEEDVENETSSESVSVNIGNNSVVVNKFTDVNGYISSGNES